MQTTSEKQGTLTAVYPGLRRWLDGFLIAKRASGTAKRTIEFYSLRLYEFSTSCEQRNVTIIDAIDAGLLREFLLHLQEADTIRGDFTRITGRCERSFTGVKTRPNRTAGAIRSNGLTR